MPRPNSKLPTLLVVLVIAVAIVVAFLALSGRLPDSAPVAPPPVSAATELTRPTHGPSRARAGGPDDAAKVPVRAITGRVIAAWSLEPVVDAEVQLLSMSYEREVLGRARTDATGRFEIEREPGGDVTFFVRAEGFLSEILNVAAGAAGDMGEQPVAQVEIVMNRGTEVTVRVMDAELDAPIADAEVTLHQFWYQDQMLPHPTSRTNALGEARILTGPEREVYAVAAGHCIGAVSGRGDPLVIRLRRADSLGGTVVDVEGAPVAGAEVVVERWPELPAAMLTDEHGGFRFDAMPSSSLSVYVSAIGFIRSDVGIPCGDLDALVVMKRAGAVAGRVILPDGTPGRGAEVNGVTSDAEGRFTLAELPAGPQVLNATGAAGDGVRVAGSVRVDVAPGLATEGVEIRLAVIPMVYAVLRIVDAGGAPVHFELSPNWGEEHTVAYRDDGTAVWGLPLTDPRANGLTLRQTDGTCWPRLHLYPEWRSSPDGPPTVIRLAPRVPLAVSCSAGEERSADALTVRNGDVSLVPTTVIGDVATFSVDPALPTCVELREKCVRLVSAAEVAAGRVDLDSTGSATVVLNVESPPGSVPGFSAALAVSGQDARTALRWDVASNSYGRGSRSGIPAGAARLLLMVGDEMFVDRPVVVPESGTLDLGTVTAPQATVARGTVRFPDGSPAGGARVLAYAVSHWDRRLRVVTKALAASDGTFVLRLRPGAKLWIAAKRSGSGSVVVPYTVSAPGDAARASSPPTLELLLSHEVAVRVRFPAPLVGTRPDSVTPCRGLEHVPLPDELFWSSSVAPDDGSTADLVAEFHGLAEGAVTFRIGEPGTASVRYVDAVLVAGKVNEVDAR